MSELKFDPYTGKTIEPEEKKEYKFDPYTGKPIEQPATNAPQFDPYTGKPISSAHQGGNEQQSVNPQQNYNAQQSYNPQQNYNAQQSYNPQQTYNAQQPGNYAYNPGMYAGNKSDSNKKVAFIVLGVVVAAFLALAVFGGVKAMQFLNKNKEALNNEQSFETPDSTAETPALEVVPDNLNEKAEEEQPVEKKEEEQQPEEQQEEKKEEQQPEEQKEEEQPAEQVTVSNNNQVDESSIFSFKVGDASYQLPEKASDFLDDGWIFNKPGDANEMIGTGELFYTYLAYPGGEQPHIMVTITNFSLDAVPAKDGYISSISFNSHDVTAMGQDVTTLGGKVVLGQGGVDDIKAAYGEPGYISESELGDGYFYYDESSSSFTKPSVMINFDENDNYDGISITNNDQPADFEQVEVSSDAPEYLSKYVAPAELGDDPFSGNFKLDGVVYNLPCPLQVFEDNGWTYDVEHDYSVGAGEGYVVQLKKGDLMLTLNTENFDTKATMLKNTMVIMISSNSTGLFANGIEFPGGFTASWSEQQLVDWIDSHNISNYEKRSSTGVYSIPFDQPGNGKSKGVGKYEIYTEDGQIDFLHFRCYGWLKD
ncbi:proline-rich domain-containing protein [Butyrivibrio sp. FC2001]|uniref:proline-rich domain-containing protein n=1 Tax=Butyrivibrio sp. FC2001 TaxID=1280671 RepID=UPI00041C6FFD|nr:proline-rich domain-containing protein [Butyrivibrio sp. FC2001]